MTDKQKAAFLRKEGWKRDPLWTDPVTGKPHLHEFAFAIATRRKSQRETRRLKAAGWVSKFYPPGDWWWFPPSSEAQAGFTRAEALRILAPTQSKEERQP